MAVGGGGGRGGVEQKLTFAAGFANVKSITFERDNKNLSQGKQILGSQK